MSKLKYCFSWCRTAGRRCTSTRHRETQRYLQPRRNLRYRRADRNPLCQGIRRDPLHERPRPRRAQEELDVVDITVPGVAHHAIACFIADAGVHILCETPIAVTLPTADLMIESAKTNNVKLEIAENYYRAPRERFLSKVIAADVIGTVARIYRIFYEGGYHGMSMLRLRAGGEPKSALGITQTTPVIPIIDRMKRHHTSERWSLGFIEFDTNATALMVYSNVIHARSLGRGQTGISQIDGQQRHYRR